MLRLRALFVLSLAVSPVVLGCAGASAPVVSPSSSEAAPSPPESPAPSAAPDEGTPPHAAAPSDARLGRPTSDAYTGDLSIFEDPGRDRALQIDRVMDVLGIRAGAVVADVGAGSGWFTVRAARRVGPAGTVHAVEINREYLAHIRSRAEHERLDNVRPILGRVDDPLLGTAAVDVVVLLKTYHELEKPLAVLSKLHRALRPGGALGIIDRHGRGDDHGVDSKVVVREVTAAGFRFEAEHDFVRSERVDYLLVFRRP